MWFWHTAAILVVALLALVTASVGKIAGELANLRMIFEIIYGDDIYGPEQAAMEREARAERQAREVAN